ncbi:MAG TPA: hypothetical protein VFX96_15780, partial [Pyrinomonadaceae bacterium]|nr:hypothetical protein [Pyrinomonadaceae bacterium]
EADVSTRASTPGDAPSARRDEPASGAERKIQRLLVTKAALETLFVLALAASFFYLNLNPWIEGAASLAEGRRVEGWVVGARGVGDEALEVQLFVDGRFAASAPAEREPAAGRPHPSGARAFAFDLPPLEAGEHEARVYVIHAGGDGWRRALHPVGAPLRVRSEGGE